MLRPITLAVLLAVSITAAAQPAATAPEAASGYVAKPGWRTQKFAVAAANPIAAQAGYEVLREGGSAIDAAIAVQMVLALVEPQSSGIGGGALLLHFDGRKVEAYDGRETAPAAATEQLFLGADGKPMPFFSAAVGGRAVGVPGVLRMLELAHREHGTLAWSRLLQPAISLARNGFAISPRLHAQLSADTHLRADPQAAAYFYRQDGQARAVGEVLRNPDLAAVFTRIAAEGSKALHEGEVAAAIVRKVRGHAGNPGVMEADDLASYRALKRAPLCHDYSARSKAYIICGFPPPSSGALAIGQILGILSATGASAIPLVSGPGGAPRTRGPSPSAAWLHLYLESSRLAFADRDQYVADPDFVQAPGADWMTLLRPAYLGERARLIDVSPAGRSLQRASAGSPAPVRVSHAMMPPQEEHGTSHISIVDAAGRAVALTTSIENAFGSRQMVNVNGASGGFLLNNQLTDFSFAPVGRDGSPIANRVQPGKRPRSSMSPTLVFDKADGALVMTVGSPGGGWLIHFTAKTLYGVLNWGLTPQRAIDLPNFGTLNGPTDLEAGRFTPAAVAALRARGAAVRERPMPSGIQAIRTTAGILEGGADPRREGMVRGD